MIALILLCIAVILLAAPGWPSPPSLAALLFAVFALLIVVTGWHLGHL